MDGNNPTFTLPHAPTPPACLQLFENGVEQFLGVDYTLSGSHIDVDWACCWGVPERGRWGQVASVFQKI
jgi:hypothetical protein